MKTKFFSRPDAGRLRKAMIMVLIAIAGIAVAIPGMILSKGNTLFALLYFAGVVLFCYALLHPWFKARYYAISIVIYLLLLVLFIYKGIDILVKMGNTGKLRGHGAEDLAWSIGSIFVAGIIAGIIGIIRVRMYTYK